MQTLTLAVHAHASDLEACLDLINSAELTDGVPDEHLPTVDDAVEFFRLRGLGDEAALRAQARPDAPGWLERVYAGRAALREIWDAQVEGRPPSGQAIASVNGLLANTPRLELRPALAGVTVALRHTEGDPLGESLARTAEPLVTAIAVGDTDRFRVCANDGCRWVFEDSSRGGRRRWCDMATCGNRAKVRRYRSRHRDAPGDEPPAAGRAASA